MDNFFFCLFIIYIFYFIAAATQSKSTKLLYIHDDGVIHVANIIGPRE